jgi:hypothetical protein
MNLDGNAFVITQGKKLGCIVNQTKVSSYRREPFWKVGVVVPLTHKQAMELDIKNNSKKWQDDKETEMHQLLEYHCKGVVIDFPACMQCYSLFGGESAFDYTPEIEISFFDYTPEIEIYFKNLVFIYRMGIQMSNNAFVTHNLIAWNARTMKEDLVNFDIRFKRRLFLEDKDPVPEDWKRSKFKKLVTSEYEE